MIYLDNAATSFPKPECVYIAADNALRNHSGNPGRSGHKLSLVAGEIIYNARNHCAKLFNAQDINDIIFTLNTTDSLNLALKGILKPGDHVITDTLLHNSVARPLETLKKLGVEVTKIPASVITGLDVNDVKKAITKNTKLLVCSHVCNVTGTVNNVLALGRVCTENNILFLVDAAQSAGVRPIDVKAMNIDLLAFPAHKGLLSPQGVGGLYIKQGLVLNTFREGGTGSKSESLLQPENSPDRYESGTPNVSGLAGLSAGIEFIIKEGIDNIAKKETMLVKRLIDGLLGIKGVKLYGPPSNADRGGVVSITLNSISPSDAAIILDSSFDIATRSGLHCAPDVHKTLGTLDKGGTLRLSVGCFNTLQEIDKTLEALQQISM